MKVVTFHAFVTLLRVAPKTVVLRSQTSPPSPPFTYETLRSETGEEAGRKRREGGKGKGRRGLGRGSLRIKHPLVPLQNPREINTTFKTFGLLT